MRGNKPFVVGVGVLLAVWLLAPETPAFFFGEKAIAQIGEKKEVPQSERSVAPSVTGERIKEKRGEEWEGGGKSNSGQDIMEQALTLLEASQEYWQSGDVESALEMLDQAYTLIINADGDPDIARQKDDLRLLISKRIITIYSAMQTARTGRSSEIPLAVNADVEKEIRSFQGVERDFFIASYQRSFRYRPLIVKELKNAGLPEELSWLPLVESGFKVSALSRARALGLWQFIPSTGYKYGLDRDDWVDERLDVEKSTRAAIAYLKDLHNMFGDWLTVLAAYNCGEGRVMREIASQRINYLDSFWDLYHRLPYETARYVPRFLATLLIIKNPEKYGMDLGASPVVDLPLTYETVKTNKPMRLQDIARQLNISEEVLCSLNTELRHKVTPDKEYRLKVPLETAEKFVQVVDQIPIWEKPIPAPRTKTAVITHRVKPGETIVSIAKKYGTSAKTIRKYNRLSQKASLRTGQYVKIPIQSRKAVPLAARDRRADRYEGRFVTYRVKKGDSLASIADRYNTTTAELKSLNRLNSTKIKVGQVLQVSGTTIESAGKDRDRVKAVKTRPEKASAGKASEKHQKTYVVRKGDTLCKIARSNYTTPSRLREINGFKAGEEYLRVGQVLVLE